MAVDEAVLRSARNAFLALMLVAVAVGVVQFATQGSVRPGIAVVWIVGAVVFYGSKWYYGRGAETAGDAN